MGRGVGVEEHERQRLDDQQLEKQDRGDQGCVAEDVGRDRDTQVGTVDVARCHRPDHQVARARAEAVPGGHGIQRHHDRDRGDHRDDRPREDHGGVGLGDRGEEQGGARDEEGERREEAATGEVDDAEVSHQGADGYEHADRDKTLEDTTHRDIEAGDGFGPSPVSDG